MRKLAQQMRKRVLLSEIFAVTRRILRHENQFFDAFFGKLMCFGNDGSEASATKMAAHLRNETKFAGPIAAFGNFYESIMTRRCQHAWRRFIVQVSRRLIA